MAELARIEERLDRVAAGAMEVSDALGGLRFQNMTEVMEFAKLMSLAGNAVPKHLQGNPGMCLAVCIQALEWRFSPFSVANKSYEVQSRLSFESQLVHAVIEQRAPIIGRLMHKFDGEGDERRCIVWATLKETGEKLEYISPLFGKIQPKNSPLWKTKPDLQLYYNTSRDFCRAYFPDVLLGVYADDELRDHIGPDNAKDVSGKPTVASRLKGGKGRGFSANHVERETRGVVDESTHITDTSEPQTSQGHPQPPSPGTETLPATDNGSPAAVVAGHQSNDSEQGAGELAQEPPADVAGEQSLLPKGWEAEYADALRLTPKKLALPNQAKMFWESRSIDWEVIKATPEGETAITVYNLFKDHFGKADVIDAQLREMGVAA